MNDKNQILFVVTHPDAAVYLLGMGLAASRRGIKFSIFFTGDGVLALSNNGDQLKPVTDAATEAIVCEHAWQDRLGESVCALKMGSQTDNSRMIGAIDKVVSL